MAWFAMERAPSFRMVPDYWNCFKGMEDGPLKAVARTGASEDLETFLKPDYKFETEFRATF